MISSPPGEWSSLEVTGQAPPPSAYFTLTTVGEKRAAMYGGRNGSNMFNHLFIVKLGRHSVVSVITYIIIYFISWVDQCDLVPLSDHCRWYELSCVWGAVAICDLVLHKQLCTYSIEGVESASCLARFITMLLSKTDRSDVHVLEEHWRSSRKLL